ncbi:DUF317 domain-containing protein [Streptomyces sp. NPDC048018]|uniref:DUF317 domain-containing protein n=1 Tax=Streptomyces sp. NPDC048018 TaxID=3365499 RepID=UPI00371FEB38
MGDRGRPELGPVRPRGFLWRASLDPAIPDHVLTAVANALSDPAPVLRPRFETDESPHLHVGQEVGIGARIVTAHRERLAEARRHRPTPTALTARTGPVALAGGLARRR